MQSEENYLESNWILSQGLQKYAQKGEGCPLQYMSVFFLDYYFYMLLFILIGGSIQNNIYFLNANSGQRCRLQNKGTKEVEDTCIQI